jgi:1,4-dihydroxy-2-naphthoate octaprenyltransferase
VWRLADPKITLASVASLTLGLAAAAREGPIAWGWLAVTWLGVFCIEVAKNASGEVFDFDSGADLRVEPADRSPFSGGKRVLVDGLLTRHQTVAVAACAYALGAGLGVVIALEREPAVLPLGILGGALAFFYHAPPLKLSYRGLGELAVGLCYGPLIAGGTFLVQRGTLASPLLLLSLPLGLLIAAFLWINEFPDRRADEAAGKRTLVVRLGPRRAADVFGFLVTAPFALLGLLVALGAPAATALGAIGLPWAIAAARRLRRHSDSTPAIVPAQVFTLQALLLYAAGTALGLLLG